MIVRDLIEALELTCWNEGDLERPITGGYASDLLSCVLAGAQPGYVWVTLQAHPNVVAVASLVDLAAVILTEGVEPEKETLQRAEEHRVTLLGSKESTFTVVGRLYTLGIRGGA